MSGLLISNSPVKVDHANINITAEADFFVNLQNSDLTDNLITILNLQVLIDSDTNIRNGKGKTISQDKLKTGKSTFVRLVAANDTSIARSIIVVKSNRILIAFACQIEADGD